MFSQAPAVPRRSRLASCWAAKCPMARFTQHASSGILFACIEDMWGGCGAVEERERETAG